MAETNKRTRTRTPYNFLYTPLELTFVHQEARRLADSGEFTNVTRAYYALETSLIPVVGRDQMADLIEMYQERGRQALEKMGNEVDRLEELIDSNDALVAFEADTIDGAIDEMRTRDREFSTVEYSRSAGGQNAFLDLMQRFDRACILVEILAQANALTPIQRYDSLNHLRSIVMELTRFVKRQYNKALSLSRRKSGQQNDSEDGDDASTSSDDQDASKAASADADKKAPASAATAEKGDKGASKSSEQAPSDADGEKSAEATEATAK